jgi:hypothetical protein
MRFLANALPDDESCDFRVVRASGHDVVAVAAASAEDDAVIEIPMREGRIFLTEDRDFGRLVYAVAKPTPGVILHRTRADLPTMVSDFVAEHGEKLAARFVVVQPGRTRFGLAPSV